MTENKHQGRKTSKVVRTPATRFGHLRKRLQTGLNRATPKTKK